jgi:hypothetical protein
MKVKTRFSCSGVTTDSDDAVRDVSALSSEYGGNNLSSTLVSNVVAKQSPNVATRLQRPVSLAASRYDGQYDLRLVLLMGSFSMADQRIEDLLRPHVNAKQRRFAREEWL